MNKVVRSTSFARVTSLAGAVVATTNVLDLSRGAANISAGWTVFFTMLAVAVAALPVILGLRFPPAVALGGCWLFVGVTVVQTTQADDLITAINNLVLYPMISCYLGWFFDHRTARATVVAMFAASGAAVFVSDNLVVFATWANLALASLFCLEAALYLRAKLDQQIETDSLTGALNRLGLAARLRSALDHVARSGSPLSVAAIDLDGFKAINDRFGHAAGDQTLVLLVDQLRRSTRQQDSIARTGGDEFMLLLPDTTLSTANQILDRSRSGSATAWSYGLVEARPTDTQESLVARADDELYRNKKTRPIPLPPEVMP